MLIAVEGITGIGKTTLQGILAEYYNAERLVQDFKNNPYLATSSADIENSSLEREAIFLFMAYHQLNNLDINGLVISDFLFDKLQVFATSVLTNDQLESIFYPCFRYLKAHIPTPNLVIRLVGSPSFALSNIRKRNRENEDYLTIEFLDSLNTAFDKLFDHYRDSKVLTINVSEYDLLGDKSCIQKLVSLVEGELPEMRNYRANK